MSSPLSSLSSCEPVDSKEPPRKRPRRESDSPHAQKLEESAWRRDERFWIPDGNVVIVAQGVGFRVYKGWLSMQSDVFRDMFSIAQPVEKGTFTQEDGSDGCPTVHVTDTALEIGSLLSVLLSGRQYMSRHKFTFTDLANCIRLANKYVIPDLLEDCLGELKRYFPEDFDSWNGRLLCDPPSGAIEAVNLARLTNTPSILPAALYSCCQLDGYALQGCVRADGVVETLSSEDLSRCINGKAKLCTRLVRLVHHVFDAVEAQRCKRVEGYCNILVAGFKAHLLEDGGLPYGRSDVLSSWSPYIVEQNNAKKGSASGSACSPCVNALCKRAKELRRELWQELPELMGLPAGDDVEDGAAEGSTG